jgi:hypothetical protein
LSAFVVTFLTREGCHLCLQAQPIVAQAVGRLGGELIEVDIDSEATLARRFASRVPVVLGPDGSVAAEGRITDDKALYRELRRLKQS